MPRAIDDPDPVPFRREIKHRTPEASYDPANDAQHHDLQQAVPADRL
jgi:hypothetical protein